MNLAVFDIDGTLTESNEIDDACFVQAFEDVLGIQGINTDWLDYQYQTDSGLTLEIAERHLNRIPCDAEVVALQSRFVELLSTAVHEGQAIREVTGASAVLQWLEKLGQWRTAIATGGWRASARFKLAAAKLPVDRLPWASAEDALDRRDIIGIAIDRAKERYAQAVFEKIIYIGDGVWDAQAAKDLGLGFVGLATGDTAMRFVEMGASSVLPDFSDLVQVSECIESALQFRRPVC